MVDIILAKQRKMVIQVLCVLETILSNQKKKSFVLNFAVELIELRTVIMQMMIFFPSLCFQEVFLF